ncbi:DUF4304 domain-containing protein [Lysinibacillus sp. BPa_S21]|uniref:DUF4304 domain-containing protein n=1 Tax=Lysinibacillus sp. BPa_S21 TaxID=2932478 RepID=UPI0020139195|nr:DUF4304 domain-containing protein [Lysinibacillus sp. BPa_S21]MCL1696195.1 DUF4304 domain-containing protein [Lysinibacillus sp. BPa_S21]
MPVLREQGFKGSFPHFRRCNENNIDLITFQFNKWGGSFVVELASCPKGGTTTYWGEKIPPNKVNAHHINKRFRLGAKSLEEDGIWFNYEKAESEEDYSKVAVRVLNQLKTSDTYWISSRLRSSLFWKFLRNRNS